MSYKKMGATTSQKHWTNTVRQKRDEKNEQS
jgi:hypothetical protein